MKKVKDFWTEHKHEVCAFTFAIGLYMTTYVAAKAGAEKALEDLKINIALIPTNKTTNQ